MKKRGEVAANRPSRVGLHNELVPATIRARCSEIAKLSSEADSKSFYQGWLLAKIRAAECTAIPQRASPDESAGMTSRLNNDTPVSDSKRVPNGESPSLLAPVWRILDSVLATVQNRLDLLRTEANEAEVRFIEMFLLASAVIIFGTLALSVTTVALVFLVWRDGSVLTLTALIAAYAFAAAWAGSELKKRLKAPAPFEATSEELGKDRECIPHPR